MPSRHRRGLASAPGAQFISVRPRGLPRSSDPTPRSGAGFVPAGGASGALPWPPHPANGRRSFA